MYSFDLFFEGRLQALKWYGENKPSHVKAAELTTLKPKIKSQHLENLDSNLQGIFQKYSKHKKENAKKSSRPFE